MSKLFVIGIALLAVATAALGQTDDRRASREREAARRAQAQAQKAEAEKAQLQQQITDLQAKQTEELVKKSKAATALQRQLSDARKREEAIEAELQNAKASLDKSQIDAEQLKKRVAELNQQLAEALAEGKRLTGELKDAKTLGENQRQQIEQQTLALQDAQEKNLTLYRLNVELLDRYNKKGVWDAMLQREPLTQVKDVRIQALLQEYRDKLDAAKLPATESAK